MPKFQASHGMRHTPEYRAWCHMKDRCFNPNDKSFKWYGAKGITICKRWLDFSNFVEDMGLRPSPRHSLDRYPNSSGNYEPGNCRWATSQEQNRNRGTYNFIVQWNGRPQTLTELAEELNLSYKTLHRRLSISKWSIDKAISKPLRKHTLHLHVT